MGFGFRIQLIRGPSFDGPFFLPVPADILLDWWGELLATPHTQNITLWSQNVTISLWVISPAFHANQILGVQKMFVLFRQIVAFSGGTPERRCPWQAAAYDRCLYVLCQFVTNKEIYGISEQYCGNA